jgi:hypothetical protein
MENLKLNIEKLFEKYIESIQFLNKAKQDILEDFKKKEEYIKEYEEALSELEKKKNELNFDLFTKETESFINVLMNFDTEDIKSNTEMVLSSIAYLGTIQHDIQEVSKKYLYIKKFWENWAIKKQGIDPNAKFAKDIEKELSEIHEEIENVNLEELQRLEDKIENSKTKIERAISIINDLNKMLNSYIFIGKEEVQFENKLIDFINNKYSQASLAEINDFAEETKEKLKSLKKSSKIIRKKVPVKKITNKSGKVYSYGIEPENGIVLNVTDIEIENPIYEDTDHFIYINNYPEHGVFEKEFLHKNMEIPDEQFEAIKEFERVTFHYFILFSILSIFTIILNIVGAIPIVQTILLVVLYPFLFMFFFSKTKKKLNKKYKLPGFFHFFETNYFIIKEGDSAFKPQYVIPVIFENFTKLFKVKEYFEKEEENKNG